MSADLVFVDTNVLLYAHDLAAARKRDVAKNLLASLWGTRTGVLSTQVLAEFYVNATRKLPRPMSASAARRILSRYSTWPVHQVRPADIIAASELEERHRQSFWDALVLISAARAGAVRIVTEDMQHGLRIAGVEIVDPFRTES